MLISIIAAVGNNNVIGNKNSLPWNLPADLEHFKQLTLNKPIVMGANTYQSIGRPLPGRFNIVLAKSADYPAKGCCVATSIAQAIELAKQSEFGKKSNELMVCGGQSVYEQFLPLADKMYLTFVNGDFAADTYFPEFDKNDWQEIERIFRPSDEQNPHDLDFVVFERKKMKMRAKIIKSNPGDASLLTVIAKKSKKYWGYPDEQIKKWEEDLTITPQDIRDDLIFKMIVDNTIAGLYSLSQNDNEEWEIDNFWILPKYIGQGLGRKLFNHLIQTAKARKIRSIKVISDPNAEGFYLKMGGKRVSEKESSIKGRMLPILKFEIKF